MSADGRQLCGAKTRLGHPCQHSPGWGTDHIGWGNCKMHGGSSPHGRQYAARLEAEATAGRIGVAIATDPHQALAEIVGVIGGEVRFLRQKVAELDAGEALSGDALHPQIRVLNAVLEQWTRASKAAVDAGVAERSIELDELVVERLAAAFRAALSEVELTPMQSARLRVALSRHLAALDGIDWRRPLELRP